MASSKMPPMLQEMIYGAARSGIKAFSKAVDSVLEDIEDAGGEVVTRVKKGRSRLKHYDRKKKEPSP